MNGEMRRRSEYPLQGCLGLAILQRPMGHGGQIGHRQMGPPVGGVRSRRNRRRIGRPHGRRGIGLPQELRRLAGCRVDNLVIIALKSRPAQGSKVRASLGRQEALNETRPVERPHLFQPLNRRSFRIRHASLIGLACQIAVRQAGIIMGRTNQTIKIQLQTAHDGNPGAERRSALSAIWLAWGQAQ